MTVSSTCAPRQGVTIASKFNELPYFHKAISRLGSAATKPSIYRSQGILTVLQLRRLARPVPCCRSTAARCFSQQRQPVVRAFHQQLCDGLACFGFAGPGWKLESLRPIEWVFDQHGLAVGGRRRWCSLLPGTRRLGVDILGYLNRLFADLSDVRDANQQPDI